MRKVLFTGNTLSEEKMKELLSSGIEILTGAIDYSEEKLIEKLRGVEGYILGGEEIATEKVIRESEQLKIISFLGTGYEKYIDVKTATELGIAVTNTPKANAYTVAEFTVGLMLDTVKKITCMNETTKQGLWHKMKFTNLRGKTLGIIGLGTIGGHIARIMKQGFGMDIVYFSRTTKPELETELGVRKVGLIELLEISDVVSINISYSNETRNLIGRKELDIMKSGSVIVNSSRAEIIDGHALYNVLTSNKNLSVAFDCYYSEPVPNPQKDEYRLLGLPNEKFIITPHTAYNSGDALREMERMVLESVKDLFEGKEPRYLVNNINESSPHFS